MKAIPGKVILYPDSCTGDFRKTLSIKVLHMKSKTNKNLSLLIIVVFVIGIVYITVKALQISSKTQIGTRDGIYTNKVTASEEISKKAKELTKGYKSELSKIQNLLDYVTHIPYKINHFKANSPQSTIKNNYGDCDDKSNLLISMLHALDKEAYFVLVPKHIFVIAPIEDKKLQNRKGLIIDGRKYYILESTAKGSLVGFPLKYDLNDISAIVEPFSNKKLQFKTIMFDSNQSDMETPHR